MQTTTTTNSNTSNQEMLPQNKNNKKSGSKPAKVVIDKSINLATLFVEPIKTIIVNGEWICQNVPCYIILKTEEFVQIKPFNKSGDFQISKSEFDSNFKYLQRDAENVYTKHYPTGRIEIAEFTIKPISINKLTKHFENNPNIVKLIDKAYQDSYTGKGNTFCINISKYNEYIESKKTSKLERIGDPIFNRTTRHTPPIHNTFTRENFVNCPSFPAPIGIRAEDFALPSEQNEILIDLITQIFNCKNAPEFPEEFQSSIGVTINKNSHICEWCGEKLDVSELNQEYCSKEHSVNFCHRDPALGTKKGNVYIGHCSCNREQGGYSEVQRFEQIMRLAQHNPVYFERMRKLFM